MGLAALVISIGLAFKPRTEMTSACAHNPASHLRLRPDRDVLPTNVVPMSKLNIASFLCLYLSIVFSQVSAVKSYEFHQKEEVLDVKLEKELPAGSKATLVIDFIGFINDKMAGFYRSSYADSATGAKRYISI